MAVPVLLLLVLELALRLAGYGYPTDFFRPSQIGGRPVWVENEWFGLRFFPAAAIRSPSPIVMEARKRPDTYRIFVMGESAALGDPRPAFGFSRYLEVLLKERFPGAQFEVINVAMTAIDSHVMLPIARECARHEGDFWLIYTGNNEFLGPFGACTVFGPQAVPAFWVRVRLALLSTRIGQAVSALGSKLASHAMTPKDWSGLRMFLGQELAPDDPRREEVYRNFQRNLDDIVRLGVHAHAHVIVSAAAVNLKDCPPFASLNRLHPTTEETGGWTNLFARAKAAQADGPPAAALPLLQQAVSSNAWFAGAQYRLAQTELALTNRPAAAEHFSLARDRDALPFRTDSRLTRIAAEIAREHAAQGVRWLDAPALLAGDSPDGVPGSESFFEHVHLNFDGNYRLALAFAGDVAAMLPAGATNRATGAWAGQALCERRLGISDWNREAVVDTVIQRLLDVPYTGQMDNQVRVRNYRVERAQLRSRLTVAARTQARALYEDAIQRSPDDHRLHENYAEFLELTGDISHAEAEWEKVCDLIPFHFSGWYQTGRLLARLHRFSEARLNLQKALQIRPDLVEAQIELGMIAIAEGHPEEALRLYDAAAKQRPEAAQIQLDRANVLAALHRRPEALAALQEAIRLQPTFYQARYLLGVEYAVDGKLAEAEAEFAEVVRLRPDHVLAHLNLGVALAQERRMDEALAQFQETLRLDPNNDKARGYIATIQGLEGAKP